MLKRQRGSSPMPFSPEPTQEAGIAPADLYEPDAKRRRYFAPMRAGDEREEDVSSADAESSDGVRTPENRRQERRWEKEREWQRDAGEYGKANRLLHDLHAEQQHRMLFVASPPFQVAGQPPLYDTGYDEHSPSQEHGYSHPHMSRSKSEPQYILEHTSRTYPLPSTSTKHGLDLQNSPFEEGTTSEEAALVSHRYEDTNRFLRSLVLSRRRDLDHHSN